VSAYYNYNDNDPKIAAWLRELIAADLVMRPPRRLVSRTMPRHGEEYL